METFTLAVTAWLLASVNFLQNYETIVPEIGHIPFFFTPLVSHGAANYYADSAGLHRVH